MVRRPGIALPLIGMLGATSWATLWLWERSPYAAWLDHGGWAGRGTAMAICQAVPAGNILLPALTSAGGWLLMTAAMMLPTTLPLTELFLRMVAPRKDWRAMLSLLIAGYLAVWMAFGVAVHALDAGAHATLAYIAWLVTNGWIVAAVTFAAAGLFQFSTLKHWCLERCRSPRGFIVSHWHGISARREAFMLGVWHGLFCLGCCWALMLVVFALGMSNFGWMLLFGSVMAVEKNMSWGHRVSAPLGIALMLGSAAIAAAGLGAWHG